MARPNRIATISDPRARTVVVLALALVALAIGVLVYLGDRVAGRAALIPAVASFAGHAWFGVIGQWLPSFVHPFAFGLLTAAVLRDHRAGLDGCAVWCGVNVAFECGQHASLKQPWADLLQGPYGQTPGLHSVAAYGLRGTFDVGDLLAIVLGTLAAASVLVLLDRYREV